MILVTMAVSLLMLLIVGVFGPDLRIHVPLFGKLPTDAGLFPINEKALSPQTGYPKSASGLIKGKIEIKGRAGV